LPGEHVILCLNVGSSSCKFSVFGNDERSIASGEVERIGLNGGLLVMRGADGTKLAEKHHDFKHRREAIAALFDELAAARLPAPSAVGHRIVHGGPDHIAPERVTPNLIADLRRLTPFAPVHMPGAIEGLEAAIERAPKLPQVVCFDTAFHRQMPPIAERFALPTNLYNEGVRRYGFHGLSYEYIMTALGASRPARIVIAHLGNGASMAAVRDGVGIDTTMGLTPTGGFMMGTRSGDLDPSVLLYLINTKRLDSAQLEDLVDHKSGLLGVSGASSDMKTLLERRASDLQAALAIEMFCYQLRKQIGAFAAALGGIDLLVFTGGIGERAAPIREEVCDGLAHLGIEVDRERNAVHADLISRDSSRVAVRVIPTNENLMIARHTRALVFGAN
jgi:acetate kinase